MISLRWYGVWTIPDDCFDEHVREGARVWPVVVEERREADAIADGMRALTVRWST